MAASGTASAIAQAIGGKKTKALQKFADAVRPRMAIDGSPQKRGPKTAADYTAGVREMMLERREA